MAAPGTSALIIFPGILPTLIACFSRAGLVNAAPIPAPIGPALSKPTPAPKPTRVALFPVVSIGSKEGDVITAFNDQELNGRQHLTDLLQKYSPEDIIYLGIARNGEILEFAVELGTLTE